MGVSFKKCFTFKPTISPVAPYSAPRSLGVRVCVFVCQVVSVDIPSGWHVEEGDKYETGFHPAVLISLTAPKIGVRNFQNKHLLGGRFLPKHLAEKYGLENLPKYSGTEYVTVVHQSKAVQLRKKLLSGCIFALAVGLAVTMIAKK